MDDTHGTTDTDRRFEELTEKRDGIGLTRDEADELGRLMAEREGKPYGNADDPPEEVEEERHAGGGPLAEG